MSAEVSSDASPLREGTRRALSGPRITKLTAAIGAEIVGIDLRDPVDSATQRLLRAAWHEHEVLVIRDQVLSRKDQTRFADIFGVLQMVRDRNGVEHPYPWMIYISNIRKNGRPIGHLPDGPMQFHSDQCYIADPPAGTMLYAIEVPSTGGNTLFASMTAAYEALPPAMKQKIDDLRALNVYDPGSDATERGSAPPDAPSYVHPVVRRHPVTGRKALFIGRLTTTRIEAMDEAEGDTLLNQLFDHQERTEFIYEHVWRPGDIVLWDNRCTLHARTDFSPLDRRLLRRLVILREHD